MKASAEAVPTHHTTSGHQFFGATQQPGAAFFSPATIQPKLTIGAPDDQYEKEADAMGERVVQMSSMFSASGGNTPGIQRQCSACAAEEQLQTKPDLQKMGEEEEEEMVQTKPDIQLKCAACAAEEEDQVQMKSAGGESTASPDLASKLSAKSGSGQPLPADTQALMGHAIGADFSAVRVHTDSDAIQMNRELSAHAFTHGRDVYFNAGKYDTGSTEGRRLLGHELGHVVQQGNVEEKKLQMKVEQSHARCFSYNPTFPIFTAIGTDPVGALAIMQAADARAIELLTNTIDELTSLQARIQGGEPPAVPTFSACLAQSMQIKLRVNPTDINSWTGNGPNTVNRIIKIYSNLRAQFQGGFVRYNCLGRDCEDGERAYVYLGQGYLINLCRPYWRDLGVDDRGLVLIHELAHHYYGTEDHGFTGLGASHCLDHFIADTNGLPHRNPDACKNNLMTDC